ncbi:MAG: polyprenyl synthetase family protein [Candidatus Cloacimonetes bacterium]|nr:polyprenyl synthetase family protein [Candidatus Cloacimonadota bacterium]
MDLKDQAKLDLAEYKQILDRALEKYFQEFVGNLKPPFTNKNIMQVVKAMVSLILQGGKRVRGTLIKYTYDAISDKESSVILDLAMATEIIHGYILMADDIMDRDEKRRGFLTAHKMLENYYEKEYYKSGKQHIGISLGLMSFTLANHLAFEIILNLKMPEQIKDAILKHLHETIRFVVYGQVLDMATEFEDNVTEKDVINVHKHKTAYYTFRNPMMTGAILAGAGKDQIKVLNDYAMNVGIAFQLRDDILGMYGDEEKIGKPVGSDIKEGKKTMLIVKALESGNKKDIEFIASKLGRPKLSKKNLEKFRQIAQDTGSLDYSHKLIQKYIKKGKQYLIDNKSLFRKSGYDFLLGIADYIGVRDK